MHYKNQYSDAEKNFKLFIETYPSHKEIDYVRYELGKTDEDARHLAEAIKTYNSVAKGLWKRNTQNKLSGKKFPNISKFGTNFIYSNGGCNYLFFICLGVQVSLCALNREFVIIEQIFNFQNHFNIPFSI